VGSEMCIRDRTYLGIISYFSGHVKILAKIGVFNIKQGKLKEK